MNKIYICMSVLACLLCVIHYVTSLGRQILLVSSTTNLSIVHASSAPTSCKPSMLVTGALPLCKAIHNQPHLLRNTSAAACDHTARTALGISEQKLPRLRETRNRSDQVQVETWRIYVFTYIYIYAQGFRPLYIHLFINIGSFQIGKRVFHSNLT